MKRPPIDINVTPHIQSQVVVMCTAGVPVGNPGDIYFWFLDELGRHENLENRPDIVYLYERMNQS